LSSYNVFAKYYDELTANIDYKKRSEYFNSIINKYKKTDGAVLLDLACGTGSISVEMAKLGYDVIGIDNSVEMLCIASQKNYENNLAIQFICQDMRNIDLYGSVDITICALDSINHLNSLKDVKSVFKKVSEFTEPDGLLIFDINTIYKHKYILANNTFTYETDDVYLVWENQFNEKNNNVKMNLEFFEYEDGVYYRSSESFTEKAYDINEIDAALKETGFEIIAHFDDDTFNPPNEKSQRIVIAARKI